jgi:hypothetical protein
MNEHASLIPGRECGGCTVCCEAPLIDEPELKKLPGVRCAHCRPPEGCAIYETRPYTCRNWYCGWRKMDLGDEWRPDRSGILIVPVDKTAPVRFEDGMELHLVGGLDKVFWRPLAMLIWRLLQNGTPVHLAVPREHGFHPMCAQLNLNEALKAAAARQDYSATVTLLSAVVQACLDHAPIKIEFSVP